MSETCFDPQTLSEPHACPGRCACYVNHYCLPVCECSSCVANGGHRASAKESRSTEATVLAAIPDPLAPGSILALSRVASAKETPIKNRLSPNDEDWERDRAAHQGEEGFTTATASTADATGIGEGT